MGQATRRVAAIAAAIAAFAALAAPASAAEQAGDSVSASVAPGSKTASKGGWYAFDAAAGSSTTQTFVVSNVESHPIVADIEAVDAYTAAATGVSYATPGTKPTATGTWLVVSTPEVTLQPGEKRSVDFTVHVPSSAKAGVYVAGMSASVPRPHTPATTAVGQKGTSFSITLQTQRVIAVQITVPGPAAPQLAVTGARAAATPDGISLVIGIANRGNAFARGSGTIRVGDTGLQKSFKIDTFVPGTHIEYRLPWTKNVIPGNHAVSVVLRYGDGRETTWNGTAAINGSLAAKLNSDLNNNRLRINNDGLPWPLMGAGFAAALLCAAGVVVLRRRRRVPQVVGATVT